MLFLLGKEAEGGGTSRGPDECWVCTWLAGKGTLQVLPARVVVVAALLPLPLPADDEDATATCISTLSELGNYTHIPAETSPPLPGHPSTLVALVCSTRVRRDWRGPPTTATSRVAASTASSSSLQTRLGTGYARPPWMLPSPKSSSV